MPEEEAPAAPTKDILDDSKADAGKVRGAGSLVLCVTRTYFFEPKNSRKIIPASHNEKGGRLCGCELCIEAAVVGGHQQLTLPCSAR